MNKLFKDAVDKMYSCLDFDHCVVGVKLLYSEDEYNSIDSKEAKGKMHYCGMIKNATRGKSIKSKYQGFNCQSAPRVLGINSSDLKNSKGELWAKLGLYKNSDISFSIRKELTYLQNKSIGVYVSPLENFEDTPDVILCICNPYIAMRIFQGYSYHYGIAKNIQIVGNQAVCNECTARTLYTKDINLSLLCIGTRHRSKWGDDKLAVGIYKTKFIKVVDGIFSTVNQMEDNKNKKRIFENLKNKGIEYDID